MPNYHDAFPSQYYHINILTIPYKNKRTKPFKVTAYEYANKLEVGDTIQKLDEIYKVTEIVERRDSAMPKTTHVTVMCTKTKK